VYLPWGWKIWTLLFCHVFIYLLAFVYLHGIHRLVFLFGRSVLCEVRTEYALLTLRGLMYGFTKDMTRTVRSGHTRTDTDGSVSRQRRCPGTTRTVFSLRQFMTGHGPQQGLYTKTCYLNDRQIRRITCMWIEISFSRKHINWWSHGLCSLFFSLWQCSLIGVWESLQHR